MDDGAVMARLAVQGGVLEQILAALQPQEEGSGLDDLVQALIDLTVAVSVQADEIRALRSAVLGRSQLGAAAA